MKNSKKIWFGVVFLSILVMNGVSAQYLYYDKSYSYSPSYNSGYYYGYAYYPYYYGPYNAYDGGYDFAAVCTDYYGRTICNKEYAGTVYSLDLSKGYRSYDVASGYSLYSSCPYSSCYGNYCSCCESYKDNNSKCSKVQKKYIDEKTPVSKYIDTSGWDYWSKTKSKTSGQAFYYSYDYEGYPESSFRYKQQYNYKRDGAGSYTKGYYYDVKKDPKLGYYNWRY